MIPYHGTLLHQYGEVDLTDQLCEGAEEYHKIWAASLEEPENYEVRANIMWAGTIAHNDLLGTGRVGDGLHTIEHEISGIYDLHGAGLAIVFPAWMKYVYKHDVQRFVQFAARVWVCDPDYHNPERTALDGSDVSRSFSSVWGCLSGYLMRIFLEIGSQKWLPNAQTTMHIRWATS